MAEENRASGEGAKVYADVIKGIVLGKPVNFMVKHGINQHHITGLRFLMLPFAILTAIYCPHIYAGIFFAVILIMDSFDGAVARVRGDPSDRGKFSDMVVDYLVYSAMVGLLIYWGTLRMDIGVYVLFISPFAYVVAAIAKNEGKDTDWIIHPFSNMVLYIAVVVVTFILYTFINVDIVNIPFFILCITMTLHAIRYFVELQFRWFF